MPGYTESLGDPGQRFEISRITRRYNLGRFLCLPVQKNPFAFMHAMLNPGDGLIVHFPGYQSHYAVAESRGVDVTRWPGDPGKGWAPDISQLESLITPATRAILDLHAPQPDRLSVRSAKLAGSYRCGT